MGKDDLVKKIKDPSIVHMNWDVTVAIGFIGGPLIPYLVTHENMCWFASFKRDLEFVPRNGNIFAGELGTAVFSTIASVDDQYESVALRDRVETDIMRMQARSDWKGGRLVM